MSNFKSSKFRCQSIMLLALVVTITGGCVSTGQQREEQAVYQRLNALEQKQAILQRENLHAQQKLNADTSIRLDNLERELKLISESVEDALARPQEIQTIDKFEFEGIIANFEKRLQKFEQGKAVGSSNSQTSQQNPTSFPKPALAISPRTTPSAREKALYDDAYSSFKRSNYKTAKDKFKKFISTFPNSSYKVNSQFWIGECYYKTEDFAEAIIKYDEIIAAYPQHPKAASALLKQGFAFLKLGDATDGKLILNKVITNYPKSDQAEIARRKLKTIK